jgi:glutamine synthetase
MYYCSVGGKHTRKTIGEEHADLCIAAGINLKVLIKKLLVDNGNFNCLHKVLKKAGDEIWVARYLFGQKMVTILNTT